MIRVFTAFSGYDSQCLALNLLARESEISCLIDSPANKRPFKYELVGWSEIDKFAIRAHNALFPQWADRNYGNISKIDWSTVPGFDLFTYSSPCQDFSQAGKQAGATKGSGTRSSLLWECERAIETKRPKYLLFENVAAVCSSKFIRLFNEWRLTLERMGYTNFAQVLNAKTHGYPTPVPQNRKRVFMVSILNCEKPYVFPQEQPLTERLMDVLETNVPDEYYLSEERIKVVMASTRKEQARGNGARLANMQVLGWTRDKYGNVVDRHAVEVANSVTASKRDNTQNYVVQKIGGFNKSQSGAVYDTNGISPTICAVEGVKNHTNIIEPIDTEDGVRIRKLTPRECFRLMGVSDADIDKIQAAGISKSQQYKMAGNSIVVNTLVAIFRQLLIGNFNKVQQTEIF